MTGKDIIYTKRQVKRHEGIQQQVKKYLHIGIQLCNQITGKEIFKWPRMQPYASKEEI